MNSDFETDLRAVFKRQAEAMRSEDAQHLADRVLAKPHDGSGKRQHRIALLAAAAAASVAAAFLATASLGDGDSGNKVSSASLNASAGAGAGDSCLANLEVAGVVYRALLGPHVPRPTVGTFTATGRLLPCDEGVTKVTDDLPRIDVHQLPGVAPTEVVLLPSPDGHGKVYVSLQAIAEPSTELQKFISSFEGPTQPEIPAR